MTVWESIGRAICQGISGSLLSIKIIGILILIIIAWRIMVALAKTKGQQTYVSYLIVFILAFLGWRIKEEKDSEKEAEG
jgi:threonine/homoserine/homoserine lactone efflux protein